MKIVFILSSLCDNHFSKRVIEFILSLPSDEFVSNGEERFLIRNSMKGLLPEEIVLLKR